MRKTSVIAILLLVTAWWVVLRTRPTPVTTFTGSTMGTTFAVRIASDLSPAQQEVWQQRVQHCLDDVNARMSTYRADSEVSCFNRSDSTDWFPVSSGTAKVVAASLLVAERTKGAFDITVGPLVNLWNFGPDRRPAGIPSDAEIEAARALVGYRRLHVRADPPALRKEIPRLTIDLSGIAKGFAVDQVGTLLEKAGLAGYMVEVGGEVRTRGTKGNGAPWRIGIERPVVGRRLVACVLELQGDCLATSGDYRNVFEWEGQLYSHEIDPRTGRPVHHGVAAVSVLSSSVMWADAYATGLMVMPPDAGWRLAKEAELEIMMVMHDEQGFRQRVTPGFLQAMAEEVN